jgi:serralysin
MATQGQTGPVPDWSGGMLITNANQHEFLYGYFETRARFRNTGPGMFPAIWLYATRGNTNPDNKGGAEIDIMEIFGDPTRWDTTLHYRDNANNAVRTNLHVATTTSDPTQWHTYAIDWQPDHLAFYLDNTLIATITGPDATWYDTPMSLRLNYALDAPWFPTNHKTNATTPTTMHMDIDYIRVYPQHP